jgi:hypothetical protein
MAIAYTAQDLFDRYFIGSHMDPQEKLRKSATRVGLSLPKVAEDEEQANSS